MNILQALILGLVQGLTEFLPISSSGHLALIQNLRGEVNVGFDVILHLATLLAVIVFFFKDILELIKGFFTFNWNDERFRTVIYLVIASVPIALVGWFFRHQIYGFFSSLYVVALGFFISGMFLFVASFAKPKGDFNLGTTLLVGISQALALIPGISRSGATVSTGILQGVKRKKAIRFSFLLAIPAMIGAGLVNFTDIKVVYFWPFLIGAVAAFISGLFAIFIFMRFLNIKRFRWLAIYCWLMAILTIIFIYLK